jgi:hypothetical protein
MQSLSHGVVDDLCCLRHIFPLSDRYVHPNRGATILPASHNSSALTEVVARDLTTELYSIASPEIIVYANEICSRTLASASDDSGPIELGIRKHISCQNT